MSENTPGDFLKRLKGMSARPYVGKAPSSEFLELHKQQQRSTGTEAIVPEEFFDGHFTRILHSQIDLLNSPLSDQARAQLAVGCVDHAELDAYIRRDETRDCYAIVLNRALIVLLNHYVKLVQACRHPDAIIYTSEELKEKSDFTRAMSKMLKDYLDTGLPHGPELKLEVNSIAMKSAEVTLLFIHRFIIAHELAHFINGDLAVSSHFAPPNWDKDISIFSKNISHEMEFKADIVAYSILMKMVAAEVPEFPAGRIFDMSAKLLFNFLRELNDRGSAHHPPSSLRMLVIAHHFFGEESAMALRLSFDDSSYMEIFERKIAGKTVSNFT